MATRQGTQKRRELHGVETQKIESSPPEVGVSQPATVTRILETTALDVFGPEKLEGEDRPVYVVFFEGDGFAGNNVMTKLDVPHPKSNLGRFHKRWGRYPEVGMKVSAFMKEDGNYQIDIAN